MKKSAKLLIPLILTSVLFSAGCGHKNEYFAYTNIPTEKYAVTDKSFTFELIDGLDEREQEFGSEDISSFTSKGWTRTGIVDAQLVIADDFSKDGAETKFSSFIIDINQIIDGIDKAVSATVENSDISKFNAASAGSKLEIGQIAYEILSEAKAAYEFTGGYYNPALYFNVLAYGFGTSHEYPEKASDFPQDEVIAKYTDLASHFNEVVLSESDGKYFVEKPAYTVEVNGETLSMHLDMLGISKGYAIDRIEELFISYNYDYGMFSYGSSSMLVRGNLREGNYKIGLINPRSPKRDTYIEIPARNAKLSTSGDNEQRYFIDGVRYCHIIDPTTGKPVQTGIMSATVIGGGAAEDDALTTAIMCMGKDKAIKFIEEKLTDRKVIFTFDER